MLSYFIFLALLKPTVSFAVEIENCEQRLVARLSETVTKWLAESDHSHLDEVIAGELRGRTTLLKTSADLKKMQDQAAARQVELRFLPFLHDEQSIIFSLTVRGSRRNLIVVLYDLQEKFDRLMWVDVPSRQVETPSAAANADDVTIGAFEPTLITLTDWAYRRAGRSVFDPFETRLTPERPIALITYYEKPAWAVVHPSWAGRPELFRELYRLTGRAALPNLPQKVPGIMQKDPVPMNRFMGSKGPENLQELTDSTEAALVTSRGLRLGSDLGEQMVVVVPLIPFGPAENEATSVDTPPNPQARLPRPEPIEDRKWQLGIEFHPNVQWRNFVSNADHFAEFLKNKIHWALPIEGGRYQLHYSPLPEHKLDDHSYFTFAFDPRGGNVAVVTVQSFEEFSQEEQRSYWRDVAVQFHFRTSQYRLGVQPVVIAGHPYDRITVSGPVAARLAIKENLDDDEITRALRFVSQAQPTSEAIYRSEVRGERKRYRLLFTIDSQKRARLITMHRL
ncbi:MAG: hypothetical protein AB7F86_01545 [Bdellovibrionales bacterium]